MNDKLADRLIATVRRSVWKCFRGRRALLVLVFVSASACQSEKATTDAPASDDLCEPSCQKGSCGDDGCGGTCGSCAGDKLCTSAGECAEPCSLTCAEAGLTCGEHCGQSCGTCAAGSSCSDGQCVCAPACAGKACGDDDGCGGQCEPCPREVSCDSCTLRLLVAEKETNASGRVSSVTLAVEFVPHDGDPLPSLADLNLRLDGAAAVRRVGIGNAIVQSDKRLLAESSTGRPFHTLDDGTIRLVVMSPGNAGPIHAGRWLLIQVDLPTDGLEKPLVARLVPHEQMFVPSAAETPLLGQQLAQPVVVWPVELKAPGGVQ